MKHLLIFLFMFCMVNCLAQQVTINGFTVKHELPSDVSAWPPEAVSAMGVSSAKQGGQDAKLVITIERGGNKICGNSPQSASIENIASKAITTNTVKSIVDNCILQPGNYTLCIEFFNADNFSVCKKQCREFTVVNKIPPPPPTYSNEHGGKTVDPNDDSMPGSTATSGSSSNTVSPKQPVTYRRPTLLVPANETKFKLTDLSKPVTLRWTPVFPRPPFDDDLLYTVRIYAIEGKQNAVEATRVNQPIFEKELKNTQLTWQAPAEYTSDKYEGKGFAWQVQATNKEGKGYGENNGNSEVWRFMASSNTCQTEIKILKFDCPDSGGKYSFQVKITNNDGVNRTLEALQITEVNGADITNINPNPPFTPNTIVVNAHTSQTIVGTFTYPSANINCVKLFVNLGDGTSSTENDCNMTADTCISCRCNYCDDKKPKINNVTATIINNASGFDELEINADLLYGTISGGNVPVYQIIAEVVGFEHKVNSPMCTTCNTMNEMHGVFINPNNNVFTPAGSWNNSGKATLYQGANYSRQAVWNNTSGVNMASTAQHLKMRIGVPEQNNLRCCSDRVRLAVRFSFVSKDQNGNCRICEIVRTACIIRNGAVCPQPMECPNIRLDATAVNEFNDNQSK